MDIFSLRLCRDFSGGSGSGGGGIINDVAYGGLGFGINAADQSNTNALNKQKNSAANAITQIGQGIQQESSLSPQEISQYSGSFDIGKYLQQLFGSQVGMNPSPTGYAPEQAYVNQGPLSQATYNQVLQQAQNPTAGWQSTLAPQLQQAQDTINKYYNSRGLMDSGMSIGAMGQAGVDLAIQNAQNEMAYQQQSLQNAGTLSSNISTLNQNNVGNLSDLYAQQQEYGITRQGQAQQGYQAGAEYMAYPQTAALGSVYGTIAGQQKAANALPGQLLSAGGKLGAAYLMGV